MRLIARWTIGPVHHAGFECLRLSVLAFSQLYDADLVICHNGLNEDQLLYLSDLPVQFIRQEEQVYLGQAPIGVAWKLTPARLCLNSHEIFLDNDLIIRERIEEIDLFLNNKNINIVLEAEARHYGRFDNHVPPGHNINSGLFGIPPGFNLGNYVSLWGRWDDNCPTASRTWDEQGLVASALTHQGQLVIIPEETISNCYDSLIWAKGMHFVGLNRQSYHRSFAEYRYNSIAHLL